ncbi:MAG: sugar ABC transporter permease [Anaerolineae bacterium]|nr:sugar ABC transporter permease [Anaerolineae bacterium]
MTASTDNTARPLLIPRLQWNRQAREDIAGYLFISPWLIGFIIFTVGPFIASFIFSLFNTNLINKFEFVGLGNYVELLKNEIWWKSLYNTCFLAFFGLATGIPLGLAIALLLNEQVAGLKIFRTTFYLPSVVAGVAVFLIWITIFDYNYGLLNSFVEALGLPPQRWLTSSEWVKPSMVLMSWWGVGGGVILYLAGLQAIPKELYEAAELDGAARPQRFRRITLPMLSPTIFFMLITGIIGSLQTFVGPLVMTGGGPNYASTTVVLWLYYNGFRYFKMGYASAMAWVLFFIIAMFSALVFRSSSAWVYYEGEILGKRG